jgi:drug/metabolite transporter (DMT)-like permease
MHVAVNYTTAINTVLVNAAQPAVTAVAAYLLGRDRLSPWQWLGIAAATGGIMIFIATFGFAAYALNIHRVPGEMGLFASLFVIGIAGSLVVLPAYIYESIWVRPMPFTWASVSAISTLAVFMTVLSMFLWNAGNRAIGPSRAGIFVNLFPVFVAAMAIVFLDEELHLYHLAGAACVCLGITLVVTGGAKRPA